MMLAFCESMRHVARLAGLKFGGVGRSGLEQEPLLASTAHRMYAIGWRW
jgi:hypothetical protein